MKEVIINQEKNIMQKNNEPSVIVDITHSPHVNLYKNAIKILMKNNFVVNVALRPRGRLISIFKKECPDVPYFIIGHHRKNITGKMLDLIERDVGLYKYFRKNRFDIGTGGGINLTHIAPLLGKPSVMFIDDIEYKLTYYLYKPFATYVVIPWHIPASGGNVLKYSGFRELAYLHPDYFKPNESALEQYNLDPYEYVFIREVSSASLNYRNMEMGRLTKILDHLKRKGLKILLSIEDKSLVHLFKKDCIIIEEPIEDIHSLLKYALFTVSSGDSMARESCLVGTPTIYTGGRDMAINRELIKRSCMFKAYNENQIKATIDYFIANEIKKEVDSKIKTAIKDDWVSTTEVILDVLIGTIQDDKSLLNKYRG